MWLQLRVQRLIPRPMTVVVGKHVWTRHCWDFPPVAGSSTVWKDLWLWGFGVMGSLTAWRWKYKLAHSLRRIHPSTHEDLKQAARCFCDKIHGETSTKHTHSLKIYIEIKTIIMKRTSVFHPPSSLRSKMLPLVNLRKWSIIYASKQFEKGWEEVDEACGWYSICNGLITVEGRWWIHRGSLSDRR